MKYFADIHCHPTIKSYGHSFPSRKNSASLNSKSSIWYYDPPHFLDKFIEFFGGIAKYRQSSFSAMGFGNAGIVFASLYPIERGFFNNKIGSGDFNDMLLNFVTSVGKKRIDFVQSVTDYFPDLENEYQFLSQLDGQMMKLADRAYYRYKLAKNGTEVDSILQQNNDEGKKANSIAVVVSIEGAHSFGTGIDPQRNPANTNYVLGNVGKVKNWHHRPVFITLAHHFYNELCGHAQSLSGVVGKVADQSYQMNTGFTKLGLDVVDRLLDNSEQKRILIDIKHMSRTSRLEYFKLLETKYRDQEIPIIISHGAVIGNDQDSSLFLKDDINFYDDELLKVAQTNGLFGLQLDERRIAAKGNSQIKKSHGLERRKVLFYSSLLAWRQIQHIAELLDSKGFFAWGIQSMGSDYDGIINPINGYWTAENYPTLSDYLLMHAHNYMKENSSKFKQQINRIDPEEIVNRIMGENAYNFLKGYYL